MSRHQCASIMLVIVSPIATVARITFPPSPMFQTSEPHQRLQPPVHCRLRQKPIVETLPLLLITQKEMQGHEQHVGISGALRQFWHIAFPSN